MIIAEIVYEDYSKESLKINEIKAFLNSNIEINKSNSSLSLMEMIYVFVEEEGELRGAGQMRVSPEKGEILNLRVTENYRNMQYGDLMIRKLVFHCFDRGINLVKVETIPEFIRFFEKVGFIPNPILPSSKNVVLTIKPDIFRRPCDE